MEDVAGPQILFLPTSLKRGYDREDMRHVIRNPVRVMEQDDGATLYVGPIRDGLLMEVGVVAARDTPGAMCVVHALAPPTKSHLPTKSGTRKR